MIEKKTWYEFRKTGLLWFINTILHTFGWAIVMEIDNKDVKDIYPARVKFRGFSEEINDEGYKMVSNYLKENIDGIAKEAFE